MSDKNEIKLNFKQLFHPASLIAIKMEISNHILILIVYLYASLEIYANCCCVRTFLVLVTLSQYFLRICLCSLLVTHLSFRVFLKGYKYQRKIRLQILY